MSNQEIRWLKKPNVAKEQRKAALQALFKAMLHQLMTGQLNSLITLKKAHLSVAFGAISVSVIQIDDRPVASKGGGIVKIGPFRIRLPWANWFRRWIRRLSNRLGISPPSTHRSFTVPILVIRYFPVKNGRIDVGVTGSVDAPLEAIRRHTVETTERVIQALETGSTYHSYKDPTAQPSLSYQIVDALEFLEPLPTYNKPGHRVPMTDYNAIMERVDVRHWVEERGVKEVWLWGYHGGVIDLWESNMAGPYGDISNSDRDPTDLPVLSQTYTVYQYNYERGPSEAVEDHIHQIESVLRHVDYTLFWDKFVGQLGAWRCGWAHYPPNGEHDYDWANTKYVWTDIEDWTPEGTGQKKRINCTRWNGDSLTWFIYWMQNLPGANNGLTYQGRPLTNWWAFIGDFDSAMAAGLGLVE